MTPEEYSPAIQAASAAAWRDWLLKNHQREENVWLIFFHKSSNVASITYDEAVDEALCFGWIDSVPKKRDHQSSYRFFSRRKPGSNWSRINKRKVEKLIAAEKMMPAGMKMVQEAKKSGTWDALNDVEALIVPDDLQNALDEVPEAKENWEKFPPSSKKIILEWLHNAKREATRQKRIEETVQKARQNLRANHYRQPKRRS